METLQLFPSLDFLPQDNTVNSRLVTNSHYCIRIRYFVIFRQERENSGKKYTYTNFIAF